MRSVVVHVDGGARPNPGPAAVAAVVSDPDDPEGEPLLERGEAIGVATNNVAEYRAVLLGLELALELGASEIEVVNDSTLIARQIEGRYKVKHAGLKPLHAEAKRALQDFERWRVRSVPREANTRADALVNQTLDAAR